MAFTLPLFLFLFYLFPPWVASPTLLSLFSFIFLPYLHLFSAQTDLAGLHNQVMLRGPIQPHIGDESKNK